MGVGRELDEEQSARWNGRAGNAWVESQELLDQVLKPFEEILVEGVSGERVLDIGCGTGGTTVATARRTGAACVGIDISEQMVDAARARAERDGVAAEFELGDAQTYAFEPATYDMLISRFGVMFFPDPVAAFTNLRRAARDNAALRCIVWRDAEENPFMTTAVRAAAHLLPDLPVLKPNEPGQFGFADRDHVHTILDKSGWSDIDIQPIDAVCHFPESGLLRYATQMGHVGIRLATEDDETRARVIEVVRPAFERFVVGDEVRFDAACWLVEARKIDA